MLSKKASVLVVVGVTWLAFTLASTDSEAVAQFVGSIVINELMYHSDLDIDGEEYVELTNSGVITVDLSGWSFSDGFDYVFPTGTVLPPAGFLVIAHDPEAVASRHGLNPDELLGPFAAKRLANSGERVALANAAGELVDQVTYDDGSPWPAEPDGRGPSLELINPDFENDAACAWAASSGYGTPGTQNSVYALDIPPCVENVIHAPVFPASDQAVVVTAYIDDNSHLASTLVYHRRDEDTLFDTTEMVDDGSGADAVAGDGMYSAQLPGYAGGALVEFYVEAEDDAGLTTRVPPNAPEIISPETGRPVTVGLLFLVEDAAPVATRPVYRLLVTSENRTELTTRDLYSNETLDATFIYGGEIYYNVGVRYRGESSRSAEPRSYRINFPATRLFNGIQRLNLVGDHISREALTYDLFQRAGMTASDTEFVDLFINSDYQALYITIEQVDELFLSAHFPGDETGNLYRGQDGADLTYRGSNPDDYRPYYLKKTNEGTDDYADVVALTSALDNSPDVDFKVNTLAVADMDQWLRWFALNALVFNQEGALFMGQGDDYFLYHRPSDGRFVLIPWDHDATFYYAAGDLWAPNLRIVKRILRHPPFTRLYYQNITALMANEFAEATMHPLIDALPTELDGEKGELKHFVSERLRNLTRYFDTNLPDRPLTIRTHDGLSFSTTQRTAVLEGGCSLWRDVYVNGSTEEVTYPSIYDWRYTTPPLRPRANRFDVTDRDSEGHVVNTRTITVTFDTFDGGIVDNDLTLTVDESPYIILDDIVVPPDVTLTIEPGVTVAFADGVSLFVEGRLLAEGTVGHPITLTRDINTQHWGVVGIYGSQAHNRLSHFVIEYAGQADYGGHTFSGVGVFNGWLTVQDGEIRYTSHSALDVFQSTAYVRRNRVHDTTSGAAVQAWNSFLEAEDNLFYSLNGGYHGLHLSDAGGGAAGSVHSNVIYDVQGDCIRLDGADVSIARNELYDCSGAGVALSQTAGLTITDNLIRQNAVGVAVEDGARSFLAHNTLVHNSVAGLVLAGAASETMMVNSIVWDSGMAISHTDAVSVTISFSDIQGGWPGPGERNINDDPQFRQPGSAVFRLRETSPCIDQGTSRGASPIDLMGISRPKGDAYDMGAFEFFEFYSVYLPLALDKR
jgi:hypothetical protein